ncbi:MAG: terminase small subunit, partial [Anaerolineae bacterium]
HYLVHGNATQAARDAGYKHPGKAGPRLRQLPKMQACIEDAIREPVMSREETLRRLSSQARAEYADFFTDSGEIQLRELLDAGLGYLIRKIRRIPTYVEGELVDERLEIEFYDAQTALIHVGKFYKLFTDRLESESQLDRALADALDAIAAETGADL